MSRSARFSLLCVLLASTTGSLAHERQTQSDVVETPRFDRLNFEPPAAGTYELPALRAAPDGHVVTSDGHSTSLHALFGNHIILLNFMYTSCPDPDGCPLATAVLQQIKKRLSADGSWSERVKLVSLSFDPQRDTPEAMRRYGAGLAGGPLSWEFVTTTSQEQLQPLLSGYDQRILREVDADGRDAGTFSHLLRVYLIDSRTWIRNIYSSSFLHVDMLINDIKTVWMAQQAVTSEAGASTNRTTRLSRPGDSKDGYEHADYRTDSLAVDQRTGQPADLLALVMNPPLGLPELPVPADNPITKEKVALGRKLFYDRRLSLNDTISCAMCHVPEQGFAHNELANAVGIEGRSVRRNAPTMYNVAYLKRLFHDGREFSLENQVWAPLLAKNEMGNPSVGMVIEKLNRFPDYRGLFEVAFGRGPSMETVGMALASYGRALNSANSQFDRWHYGNQDHAMSARAQRGYALFTGTAKCVLCHTIGKQHALFTDHKLHNTGVGYVATMGGPAGTHKVQLAPGVEIEVSGDVVQPTQPTPNDLGLYEITQNPDDRWKYRTPSLRNVALTRPYMHDGSLQTLKEVVEFYNRGGVPNALLDPLIQPLGLNEVEVAALVAFLRALTGDNVDLLVSDAFAAPIGDVTENDPHWSHEHRVQFSE